MFINAEKWVFDNNASFKIVEFKKCCDDIIKSPNTCLNSDYGCYEEDEEDEYSVKLIQTEYDHDMGDLYYYEKINFCPFCGKPIYVDIIREIDKNEIYDQLTEERKMLWDKWNKTDRKQEVQKLGKRVNELDKEINNLYESDGLR